MAIKAYYKNDLVGWEPVALGYELDAVLTPEERQMCNLSGSCIKIPDIQAAIDVVEAHGSAADVLQRAKDVKISEVKCEAKRRIYLISDSIDQRNKARRYAKFLRKKVLGTVTQVEEDEMDAVDVISDQIDNIRDASDAIESDIEIADTVEEINNYDITNSPLWP